MLFVILIALLSSCEQPKEYIIQTDFSLLAPDTINGETVAQSKKKFALFTEMLNSNTINKFIPDLPIYSLSGKEYNLQNVISKKTILVSSDNHCGFGKGSLLEDFPIALDSLKDELKDYEIICLAKRIKIDIEDSLSFVGFTAELNEIYDSIYIIEESDAHKMNLFGNPIRFYIDKNQRVAHIATGLSNVEFQIVEIRKNIDTETH